MTTSTPPATAAIADGPDYAGLLYWLRSFVAAPLSGEALQVRGIMPPAGDRTVPRIALWDGCDPASSVAFDIAVEDAEGYQITPSTHILLLRQLAQDHLAGRLGDPHTTDGFGIPVHDVRDRCLDLLTDCHPTISDALDDPLRALTAYAVAENDDCAFWGWVLADLDTGRYYARVPGGDAKAEMMVGIDMGLRDCRGRVLNGIGMLDAYLPSLARDRELEQFRVSDGDDYCDMVCDLTEFVGPADGVE